MKLFSGSLAAKVTIAFAVPRQSSFSLVAALYPPERTTNHRNKRNDWQRHP